MQIETLQSSAALRGLGPGQLSALGEASTEIRLEPGAIVASEGDRVHSIYLLVAGALIAQRKLKDQTVLVGQFTAGDVVVEEGTFGDPPSHSSTYRATADLHLVAIPLSKFAAIVGGNAVAREHVEQTARDQAEARFLRLASPFSGLAPLQLRRLAESIEAVRHQAGDVILREGEIGDRAFLITAGTVDVVLGLDTAGERTISTLKEGMIFGEASLLTGEVRNASARAKSDVKLLRFTRDDFAAAIKSDRTSAKRVIEFLGLRSRPRRAGGIEATTAIAWNGEEFVVLKNAMTGMSYKLSPEGAFLWERLDGRHTLRDLTLDYFSEFKSFSPMQIAELLGGLAAAGFLTAPGMPDLALVLTPAQRAALKVRELLTKQFSVSGTDRLASALHRGFHWMLHPSAHIVYGAVAVIGLMAFCMNAPLFGRSLAAAGWLWATVSFLLAYIPSIVIHEAAHALVAKKYGAVVPRIGYGWNWIAPVAFVDTADMWRQPRGPRIRTSLAGPYANLVLAGVFTLVALAFGFASPLLSAAAILGYAMAVFNMLPLLGFDGHHVLKDLREERAAADESAATHGTRPEQKR